MTQPIEPSPSITLPADLLAFLQEPRDSREYRRALAVKLALQQLPYAQICALLDVSPGFVSQQKQAYESKGVAGLVLTYRGAKPLLDPTERQAVLAWLKASHHWSLIALQQHIQQTYQVMFQSDQSYYDLFAEAGIHYKKTQAQNPKRNSEQVVAKKTKS
jgi:putative transposase